MAFRFPTGFFGSPILAIGGATVTDLCTPKKHAYGMTLCGVFAASAPGLSPLLGSFSVHFKGWRWTIWEFMWLSSAALVLLFFFYPETSASNILYWRTHCLCKAAENSSIVSASEIGLATMSAGDLAVDILVTHSHSTPRSRSYSLSLSTLALSTRFSTSGSNPSRLFSSVSTSGESSCSGYPSSACSSACSLVCPSQSSVLYSSLSVSSGLDGHHARVYTGSCPLLVQACSASPHYYYSWVSPRSVIFPSETNVSFPLRQNAMLSHLADAYPSYAASVLAGNDFIRSMFGAGFLLFARAMYINLGVGWASTLLALLSCAFVLLYKYGEHIRMASIAFLDSGKSTLLYAMSLCARPRLLIERVRSAIIRNIERMDEAGLATMGTGRVVLCGSRLRKAFERAI
jgi:MFS transporter, DHA1 family, multidrug resistance protein